jgi:hypothetical protein
MKNINSFSVNLSVFLSRQLHSPQSVICNNVRSKQKIVVVLVLVVVLL